MTREIEWTRNTKTGSQGIVVTRYVNTRTGKAMVQVEVGVRTAYWLAAHTEEA